MEWVEFLVAIWESNLDWVFSLSFRTESGDWGSTLVGILLVVDVVLKPSRGNNLTI